MPNEPSDSSNSKLDREIGLPGALAIGIGTMVGAGIFVFPGLVAQRVGEAGILSFLLAGVVALIVAYYTSELATDMPLSGGGYTFTRRVFGEFCGSTIGLAQWAGLIFASAFYLAAFGSYTESLMGELGFQGSMWVKHIAPMATLLLIGINIVGSRNASALQNGVVLFLLMILLSVFLRGLFQITALEEGLESASIAKPNEWTAVVTTAAMIFTAYIGFVQIATVGGEIKCPERNLPLSLIGSVVVVILLYALVYHVSVKTLGVQQMSAQGKIAVAKVAGISWGPGAAMAILGAGVLASLSSANASILSSSRTIFALSRDEEVPEIFGRIWQRFQSPSIAVIVVGTPAAFLSYFSVERLAEIASLLHLVIYGLICLAVAKRRWRPPENYQPPFRARSPAWLAVLAGLLCFGLIAFMPLASVLAGILIIAVSAGSHLIYRRVGLRHR